MPPRLWTPQGLAYPFGAGRLLPVREVVGVPTYTPSRQGPYLARNVLTGKWYAWNLTGWLEFGRDYPAIALIQTAGPGSGSANSVTLTYGANPTPGSLQVLAVAARNNQPNNPTGFTLIGSGLSASAGAGTGKLWYRVTQAGDSAGVTITTPGSDFPAGAMSEFAGVSAIPASASAINQTATTTPQHVLVPSGAAPWLEVSFFIGGTDGAGQSGPTALGAGWTQIWNAHPGSGDAFAPYAVFMWQIAITQSNPNITSPSKSYGVSSFYAN